MKRRVLVTSLTLVLASFCLSFNSCPPAQQEDAVRKAARAADDIAEGIKAAIKAKRDLKQHGKITPQEDLALSNLLLKVNSADKVLVNKIKELKTIPDASTKASLAPLLDSLVSAVDELNKAGVLGIKNPDAQKTLTTIMNTITAALAIVKAFLT